MGRLQERGVEFEFPKPYDSGVCQLAFFEYPDVRRGRAGAGMIHTVDWRVSSESALDFWEERLQAEAAGPDVALVMDEDTFRAFYDRTARSVWAYLSRMTGDPHLADDLLQDV